MVTNDEKSRLAGAVAAAVEVAYRRGFHHGFVAAQGERGETFDEHDVERWRFSDSRLANRPSRCLTLAPWCNDPLSPLDRALHDGPGAGYQDVLRDFTEPRP